MRTVLTLLSALFLLSLSPMALGKDFSIPNEDPHLLGFSGLGSTALSNLKTLSHHKFAKNLVEFELPDGTKLGGLYFPSKEPSVQPLMILNFGIFADRWSGFPASFVDNLVQKNRLTQNVLIVDSATSAPFLATNLYISLGGYDEGRILVQLAQVVRKNNFRCSTIHLVGVSLGGNAILQALIEDQRLQTRLFASGTTFAGVIDEIPVTVGAMRAFGYEPNIKSDYKLSSGGKDLLYFMQSYFNKVLKRYDADKSLYLSTKTSGALFTKRFMMRVNSIKIDENAPWNPAVRRSSVEDYLQDSAVLINEIDKVKVPIVLVHAEDDPLVPYGPFRALAQRERDNPNILTHGSKFGGHWGYFSAYGSSWVESVIARTFLSFDENYASKIAQAN
jgi:predicted alpha/beta-fold hydrolase